MKETIVITGLGQGMGREVAKMLAKQGNTIAGFDIDAGGIESLAEELGGGHLLKVVDITDRAKVAEFGKDVLEKFGKVDVLLSNAGIGFFGPFEEVDLEQALKCFEINVLGAAAAIQSFLPSMREAGKGRIVVISSMVGLIPFPFESIYSASKFALEGLVHSMRLEVEPFGIRVALVQPAQVSSAFAEKSHRMPPENSPYYRRAKKFLEKDAEHVKTAPTPKEAARKIVRIVNDRNPKLQNQIEAKSTMLLVLNKVLPTRMRDSMLLNHMDIKP